MLLRIINCVKIFNSRLFTTLNLTGRNYLTPNDFTSSETKSILWTASDVKQLTKLCQQFDNIKSSRITLLMHKPSMEVQASAMSAANILKSQLNVIIDPLWDSSDFANDSGSFLSLCSDMVFCQTQYQSKIVKLAEGATIPVVSVQSCTYAALNVLADMLAVQGKYGHLNNLNIGWVGKSCPLLNSYLCIAPQLGINVQYYCTCKYSGESMSPAVLPLGKKLSEQNHTILNECDKVEKAIDKVNVIVVAKHKVKQLQLELKCIEANASKNWSFLHQLPRGHIEVTSEVFDHKNSLVWEATGNLQYIYAAFMLRLLSDYQHVNKEPEFDKNTECL